jgi:hypothetical protein
MPSRNASGNLVPLASWLFIGHDSNALGKREKMQYYRQLLSHILKEHTNQQETKLQ